MPDTPCPHPPDRAYAWWVYDPVEQDDVLCHGCTQCGAILSGGVDDDGQPVGPVRTGRGMKGKRKERTA